ncbi:hypothetical protein [Haloparvum sedimenti]|uniref:hypothetical protein n=1 Tax=Haloparvum sedimenti TaxID=1678448 RepID=UPI00071E691E|nr:hypothetical protein [Haloparvum sedimenti]
MTDVDETMLTAAKLREQIEGHLESHAADHKHAGIVEDEQHRATLSFIASATDGDFYETDTGEQLLAKFRADRVTDAVSAGNSSVLSHLTGVTEQDLDGSALRLPLRLVDALENNDATAFVSGAGNPNTGKTNLMALLAELRSTVLNDLLVISNARTWDRTDLVVTSAHDLAVTCLEHRDRPKFVFVDEGSTHFDARTKSREVAVQFTPLAKRFAKINVDTFGTVGHTGKDLHPEVKRLTTLAFFKLSKKEVDFYGDWPADADHPTDRQFGGTVEGLEPALEEPDPDDAAPWDWNLEPDLFARDLDWPDLLELLQERGPAD